MNKAVLVAVMSATVVGCGVSPTIQASQSGSRLSAKALLQNGLILDAEAIERLKTKAEKNRRPQPAWKTVVSDRAMTDQEKNANYQEMMASVFAEGKKNKGEGVMEVVADAMTAKIGMGPQTTIGALFQPHGSFGGLIEVIATDGAVKTYDWGFSKTMEFKQGKAAMGEPLLNLQAPDEVKKLEDLLIKAKILPLPATVDSVNAYLNPMPRRKPDMTIEWFPAYIAVSYEGHYYNNKMLADAMTGQIYLPKP